MKVEHPFNAIYDKNSVVLLLGSLPSVKSREMGYPFASPMNRLWKTLEIIFNDSIENNREVFLKRNRLAMWDVIQSCDIEGSSDASISNVTVNDIGKIVRDSRIK